MSNSGGGTSGSKKPQLGLRPHKVMVRCSCGFYQELKPCASVPRWNTHRVLLRTNSISLSEKAPVFQQLRCVRGSEGDKEAWSWRRRKRWLSVWEHAKKVLLLPDRRNRGERPAAVPRPSSLWQPSIIERRGSSVFKSMKQHFVIFCCFGSQR